MSSFSPCQWLPGSTDGGCLESAIVCSIPATTTGRQYISVFFSIGSLQVPITFQLLFFPKDPYLGASHHTSLPLQVLPHLLRASSFKLHCIVPSGAFTRSKAFCLVISLSTTQAVPGLRLGEASLTCIFTAFLNPDAQLIQVRVTSCKHCYRYRCHWRPGGCVGIRVTMQELCSCS